MLAQSSRPRYWISINSRHHCDLFNGKSVHLYAPHFLFTRQVYVETHRQDGLSNCKKKGKTTTTNSLVNKKDLCDILKYAA